MFDMIPARSTIQLDFTLFTLLHIKPPSHQDCCLLTHWRTVSVSFGCLAFWSKHSFLT
jgi:hypothetical protein